MSNPIEGKAVINKDQSSVLTFPPGFFQKGLDRLESGVDKSFAIEFGSDTMSLHLEDKSGERKYRRLPTSIAFWRAVDHRHWWQKAQIVNRLAWPIYHYLKKRH